MGLVSLDDKKYFDVTYDVLSVLMFVSFIMLFVTGYGFFCLGLFPWMVLMLYGTSKGHLKNEPDDEFGM